VSATVRLTIPARAEYLVLTRLVLTGIAMEVPMSEVALADLKLAVTEVCGNAVQHAYPDQAGAVRIAFEVESESIEVSVEDEGPGAAFPEADESVLDEGPVESGMGLAIVRSVMDEVEIDDESTEGTVVRMRKQFAGQAF
jgi:serine/threonine-protein kinase RsbW